MEKFVAREMLAFVQMNSKHMSSHKLSEFERSLGEEIRQMLQADQSIRLPMLGRRRAASILHTDGSINIRTKLASPDQLQNRRKSTANTRVLEIIQDSES